MEKSKEKRAENAKLLSDELDRVPTKQPALQQKPFLKRNSKSITTLNFKSNVTKPVLQQTKRQEPFKVETLSDKSTSLSEIAPSSSGREYPIQQRK